MENPQDRWAHSKNVKFTPYFCVFHILSLVYYVPSMPLYSIIYLPNRMWKCPQQDILYVEMILEFVIEVFLLLGKGETRGQVELGRK